MSFSFFVASHFIKPSFLEFPSFVKSNCVLVITCLRGKFGINFPSTFLKILKMPKSNQGNRKIFKNHEDDLSQKLSEPKQTGY